MAPIHDTDIASERWSQAEWQHYELWEKIEVRLRRRKGLWVMATAIVFLVLSAIPIWMDRWPKWKSLSMVRHLAREINQVKLLASTERNAYRLRFIDGGSLNYEIEKTTHCSDPRGEVMRTGHLGESGFALIDPDDGKTRGIPGLITSFCYDFLAGSEMILHGESLVGFAIAPVKDLAQSRSDRISTLILKGTSAEISFE